MGSVLISSALNSSLDPRRRKPFSVTLGDQESDYRPLESTLPEPNYRALTPDMPEPPAPIPLDLKRAAGAYRPLTVKEAAMSEAAPSLPMRESRLSLMPDAATPGAVSPASRAGYGSLSVPPFDPEQALRERSPAFAEYRRLQSELPTQQRYEAEHERRGVGGRLKSGLRTAGKVFLRGLNPIDAILSGAIAAGDPRAEARFDYLSRIMPQNYAQQDRALQQAGREIGLQNVLEDNEYRREQFEATRADRALDREHKRLSLLNQLTALQNKPPDTEWIGDTLHRYDPKSGQFVPMMTPSGIATRPPKPKTSRNPVFRDFIEPGGRKVTKMWDEETGRWVPTQTASGDVAASVSEPKDETYLDRQRRIEAEVRASKPNIPAEITRRMDDLREAWYDRFGVDPDPQNRVIERILGSGADAAAERAEESLRKHVEDSIEQEIQTEVARRMTESSLSTGKRSRTAAPPFQGAVPASRIAELARKRGVWADEFRKQLAAAGIPIDEDGKRGNKTGKRAPKVASSADIADFAREYFGGDENAAREYLKKQGYTIRSSKGALTREQVQSYADANTSAGYQMTYDQARSYLRSQGYSVP